MIHKEKLDSLCHINSGGTPSRGVPEYYGGKIPWAKIGDIEKSNGVIYSTEEYITEAGLESIGNRIFPKDTLLFAMYGSVGKVAFCGIELSTNQAILGIRLKQEAKEKLDLEYLKYWFQVNLLFFKNRAVGGILKNLSATIVRDFDIPLPSLTDQKRIAKILSECEALIQKRKESIDLLDELLKTKFFEMFGDPRTNSKEWELDSAITYVDCIVPARDKPKSFTGVTPWVTTTDLIHLGKTKKSKLNIGLTDDEISDAGARIIPKDSVIMTCVGDLGVITIAECNMVINQQLHAFQCKTEMNNIFLMYVLSFQKYFMYKVASKTTVPYLNKTNCNSIPVIKPPIELQTEFAQLFEKANDTKKYFIDSFKELENLYGSISQRAFNSELDLSKVDISDMEDSKKKDLEEVKEDLTEEQLEDLLDSFEHNLPTGEVPSNRETDIRNMSIRQYLRLPDNEETEGIEFSFMNKDFFYQFYLTKYFADRVFTLSELERSARKYILRGSGFEFTYENWKTIIFRFIGAKQPIIEQLFDEETKTIKLKLTDEAFKV